MAIIVAQANGNFSAAGTWAGGVVPGAGDVAQTGNYTVTIDASVECTLNPTGSGYFKVTSGGITITGDLVMQSSYTGGGLRCEHNSGTVALTGTATAGAGNSAYGATNNGAGTLTVGTATGGAGNSAYGATNNGAGTLTVGTATGGAGGYAYGAYNNAAGTLTVDLAVGNNWGVGGGGGYAYGVCGSGVAGQVTRVKRIQSGPYGAPAIGGAVLMVADATNSAQFRTAYGGATKTLTDPNASADWPAVSDVRHGTQYDNGDRVGTAHIPAPGQVALGIPVDATTGTAVLTAAAVAAGVDKPAIAAAVLAAAAETPISAALAATQGAVTFGQVKILVDVAGEGALHVENSNAGGYGQYNYGGDAGQLNNGGNVGQGNYGGDAGQYNYGGDAGQKNKGNNKGQHNYGTIPVIGAASQEIADALKRAPAAGSPAAGSVYDLLGNVSLDIDPQGIRDAMLLAPTPPGTAAVGSVDALLADVSIDARTILARIGAWTGSGVNTILGAFRALLSKAPIAPSDIGGTFTAATDSTEAIRDALDMLDDVVISIKERTDRIGAGSVTIVSPQSADGRTLNLIAGDDYLYSDNRHLSWTDTGGTWPDLTGGCMFCLDGGAFSKAATVSNGTPRVIRLSLTAAETAAMADLNPKGRWHLVALDADDPAHVATFLRGVVKIERL